LPVRRLPAAYSRTCSTVTAAEVALERLLAREPPPKRDAAADDLRAQPAGKLHVLPDIRRLRALHCAHNQAFVPYL
jgi:hypothetical protein